MIEILPAGIEKAELITEVGAKSFEEAFGSSNAKEDLEFYISKKFTPENIKAEISDPNANFFLAWYNNTPAGYAKLIKSPLPEQIKNYNAVEMQRIYSLREFYSMKIGKELMITCLNFAKEAGYNSMWLGVWQLNHRAVEFYKKWGFEIFGTRNFKIGNAIKDDYLMIKKSL